MFSRRLGILGVSMVLAGLVWMGCGSDDGGEPAPTNYTYLRIVNLKTTFNVEALIDGNQLDVTGNSGQATAYTRFRSGTRELMVIRAGEPTATVYDTLFEFVTSKRYTVVIAPGNGASTTGTILEDQNITEAGTAKVRVANFSSFTEPLEVRPAGEDSLFCDPIAVLTALPYQMVQPGMFSAVISSTGSATVLASYAPVVLAESVNYSLFFCDPSQETNGYRVAVLMVIDAPGTGDETIPLVADNSAYGRLRIYNKTGMGSVYLDEVVLKRDLGTGNSTRYFALRSGIPLSLTFLDDSDNEISSATIMIEEGNDATLMFERDHSVFYPNDKTSNEQHRVRLFADQNYRLFSDNGRTLFVDTLGPDREAEADWADIPRTIDRYSVNSPTEAMQSYITDMQYDLTDLESAINLTYVDIDRYKALLWTESGDETVDLDTTGFPNTVYWFFHTAPNGLEVNLQMMGQMLEAQSYVPFGQSRRIEIRAPYAKVEVFNETDQEVLISDSLTGLNGTSLTSYLNQSVDGQDWFIVTKQSKRFAFTGMSDSTYELRDRAGNLIASPLSLYSEATIYTITPQDPFAFFHREGESGYLAVYRTNPSFSYLFAGQVEKGGSYSMYQLTSVDPEGQIIIEPQLVNRETTPLRFVNMTEDIGTLRVDLDEREFCTVESFSASAFDSRFCRTAAVVYYDSSVEPVLSAVLDLFPEVTTTVLVAGSTSGDGLNPIVVQSNVTNNHPSVVTVVATSPDAEAWTITRAGEGDPIELFEDLQYAEPRQSDRPESFGANFGIQVHPTDDPQTVLASFSGLSWTGNASSMLMVVCRQPGGSANDIRLFTSSQASSVPEEWIEVPRGIAPTRLIHLAPGEVDAELAINGVDTGEAVQYASAGEYSVVDAINLTMEVHASGNPGTVLADTAFVGLPDIHYSMVLCDNRTDRAAWVLKDIRTAQNVVARVRFAHAAPNMPELALYTQSGTSVGTPRVFHQATSYVDLTGGQTGFELRLADTNEVALTIDPYPFEAGRSYTIYVTGLVGEPDHPVTGIVVVDGE